MSYLKAFAGGYLAVGVVYAIYVSVRGKEKWYVFPINVLGGPVTVLYILYATWRGKRKIS